MKSRIKRAIAGGMMLLLSVLAVGCGGDTQQSAQSTTQNQSSQQPEKLKVGIVQIVEHPSLNTIRENCIKGMHEGGFIAGENMEIDYQNAQNDPTNLQTICQKFVGNQYDLIIAIATPSAQSAVGRTKDIPIVFSACTDPIGAELVGDLEKPGGNVTGVSDAVSAQEIMELALRITPNIKTVGALYNSGETNSVSVINDLKAYAQTKQLQVVEATVTNSSEVQQATASLMGKVDAVFSPIDNTVASAMPLVAKVANASKIPVYVGADSMVQDGGLATKGVNYEQLGIETGKIAARILNGEKAGDISVVTMKEFAVYVNPQTAEAIGITIPQDIMEQATVLGVEK